MFILYAGIMTYLLYIHFLAYVALWASKKSGGLDDLPIVAQGVAKFILCCAVVIDAIFNITVGSVIFLELPRCWMFTTRCSFHMYEQGYRGKLARWCCRWLNPIQPGHCH